MKHKNIPFSNDISPKIVLDACHMYLEVITKATKIDYLRIGKSNVLEIIAAVSEAVMASYSESIKFMMPTDDVFKTMAKFEKLRRMLDCVGVIDGTHVK